MTQAQFLRKFVNGLSSRLSRARRRFCLSMANLRCRGGGIRSHFVYRRKDGSSFVYLRHDPLSHHIFYYPDFELDEILWAQRWLAGGGTLLDGGANIGMFSAAIAQKCPLARIESFECAPETFEKLKFVMRRLDLPKVQLHFAALSWREEQWIRNVGGTEDPGQNQVQECAPGENGAVRAVTLTQFLRKNFPAPVLIKLDIEGSEYDALCGMDEYLKANNAPTLIMEINKPVLAQRGIEEAEVWAWLARYGYRTYFGGGFGLGPHFGIPVKAGDALPSSFNLIAVAKRDSARWKKTCAPF